MRKVLGMPFKILGAISAIVFGLWGMILTVGIVSDVAGFLGVCIGFILFPVMFVAAPWYALVAWGDWLPLLVCYGGGILFAMLYVLGQTIAGDE